PLRELEIRDPRLALEPDGRDLRDRTAQPARLRRELEADLKAVPTIDSNLAHEGGRVRLEGIRRIARADTCEELQRTPGHAREHPLAERSAHLLSAGHVPRGGRDDDTALDEAREIVDE